MPWPKAREASGKTAGKGFAPWLALVFVCLAFGPLACGWAATSPARVPSLVEAKEEDQLGSPVLAVAYLAGRPISCEQLRRFSSSPAQGRAPVGGAPGDESRDETPDETHDETRTEARVETMETTGDGAKGESISSRLTALAIDTHLARQAESLGLDQLPAALETLRRYRRALLINSLEQDLAEGIEVSAKEIEQSFRDHPERHLSPERLGTRFLLLRLAPGASPQEVQETRQRLLEIRRQVTDAASFTRLAILHSEAENGSRGGAVAASPRGSLLAAYEEVAWSLRPGEVSDPFRLPDGLALVFVEDLFEARSRTLEEASKGIESRLHQEKLEARRQQALTEAGSLWPVEIRWLGQGSANNEDSSPREPVVTLAGEQLTLADLGLDHRPPRLEERLEKALSERWLFLLAEHRGYGRQAAVAAWLEDHRRTLLAQEAIEARVGPRLPEVPEGRLQELYEKRAQSLRRPEQRRFEVVLVPAQEGRRRGALAQAQALHRVWVGEGQLPPGTSREYWGPLTATNLGNAVSPRLARIAFGLEPGQVSKPLVMERYSSQAFKFVPEGYVLLLPEVAAPSLIPSLEEARATLRQQALRKVSSRLRDQAWAEVERALPLVVNEEGMAACEARS